MASDGTLNGEQVARQVDYWLDLAAYDMDTAVAMLSSGRLLYVTFMCHQVVEKALKGLYSARRQSIAPRIHALVALAQRSGVYEELTNAQQDFLERLDPMNIECRYPAEKEKLLAALTIPDCEGMISETREMLQWIKQQLSSE